MSASDGLARLARRVRRPEIRSRVITGFVSAAVLVCAFLPGHQPHWRVFNARHYRDHPTQHVGERALATIPTDASVVAQAALAPHLSQRQQIHILEADAPDMDFVIASARIDPWPTSGHDEIAALVTQRQQRGYVTVFEQDGWIVLRRP